MRCVLALPLRVSFRLRVMHCEWRLAKSLAELNTTIVTGAVRVVGICRELGYGVQGAKVHLQFQFINIIVVSASTIVIINTTTMKIRKNNDFCGN